MSIATGHIYMYRHNAKQTLNRQVKWYNEHCDDTCLHVPNE